MLCISSAPTGATLIGDTYWRDATVRETTVRETTVARLPSRDYRLDASGRWPKVLEQHEVFHLARIRDGHSRAG